MDYPTDIWEYIYFYIPEVADLARIRLTGDSKAMISLRAVRLVLFQLRNDTTPKHQMQAIFFASTLSRAIEIGFVQAHLYPGISHFRSPGESLQILPRVALSSLSPVLHTLDLTKADMFIHPSDLSLLPTTLRVLKSMIGFLNDKAALEFPSCAPVDLDAVSWPSLSSLHFSGAMWKLSLNEKAIKQLPTTLTDLQISSVPLNFTKAVSNPFEHLSGVVRYGMVYSAMDQLFLPPNVTDLRIEFTTRPSKLFPLLPRSVRHFTAMTSQKMRAPHDQCLESDFGGLPRGLETLVIHEATRFKNVDLLRTTIPPRLTRISLGKVPLYALIALPPTITDLGVELADGELPKSLGELFPALKRVSLSSTWNYALPEAFFLDWPLTMTEITLGTQSNVPSNFFKNLRNLSNLRIFASNAQLNTFTIDTFTHLPPSLRELTMSVSHLSLNDEHIRALPRGLKFLRLSGADCLTDASVPLLPPLLAEFICHTNCNFTKASVKLWPIALRRLEIGATDTLSYELFATEFKKDLEVMLLYSTH